MRVVRVVGFAMVALAVCVPSGLAQKPSKESAEKAAKTLAESKDPKERVAAAKAIADAGKVRAAWGKPHVPVLIAAAKDTDAEVRKAVAEALGVCGADAKDAIPVLTGALDDSEVSVQQAAAAAIVYFGRDAAPALPKLEEMKKKFDMMTQEERQKIFGLIVNVDEAIRSAKGQNN